MLYSVYSTESGTSSNSQRCSPEQENMLLAVDSLQFENIGTMSSTVGKSSTPQVFHVALLGLELCLMIGSRDTFFPHQAREHSATSGKESDAHSGRAGQLVQEAMQDGGEVLFLDGIGEVVVSVGRDGLSLQPLHQELVSSCWSSITLQPKLDNKIKFLDVYAIELLDKGPISGPWNTRTAIHGKTNIEVFVHPLCGKGRGVKNWETVAPLFDRAKIKTKVIVTDRAGHAYDTVASLSDIELKALDGVVAVVGQLNSNSIC
nr:unnamed protein product [Digitaria exilis]